MQAKHWFLVAGLGLAGSTPGFALDVPRYVRPASEFAAASSEAAGKSKPLIFVQTDSQLKPT